MKLTHAKDILGEKNLKPLKKFSQNFLIDEHILEKIISASNLDKTDVVVEIGPGLGVLTKELAKHCKKVIAIEKDRRMVKMLRNIQGVEVIESDILKYNDFPENYKVVANLPYHISLAVIMKFLEIENPPKYMILMIQKEVADKLTSQKGSLPKIALDFYAKSEFLFKVPKTSFYPQPKVDGAMIKIFDIQNKKNTNFFKTLKSGFVYPRKTILNNLSKTFEKEKAEACLKKAGIDSKKRPQDLLITDWLKLCDNLW